MVHEKKVSTFRFDVKRQGFSAAIYTMFQCFDKS